MRAHSYTLDGHDLMLSSRNDFHLHPTLRLTFRPPSLLSHGYNELSSWGKLVCWAVRLTTHFHPVLRLKFKVITFTPLYTLHLHGMALKHKGNFYPLSYMNYKKEGKKSKAVLLHAMEAHGGRGGTAPTHT
jgi:hypothetical protein